jgi:predicted DNA-binding ribbon-helix-helix protein
MKSLIVKRSVVIAGHKTSISLEDPFWKALKEIATFRKVPLSNLVASVDLEREHANLSSAVRLFILDCYRAQFGRPAAVLKLPREDAVVCPANSA